MNLPTLTLVLMLAQQAIVQRALAQGAANSTSRIVISVSGGAFFPRQPGRNVEASFPYTSKPVSTGITTASQFSGSLSGNFPSVTYVGDIMNIEVTAKGHAINGGIGLFHEVAGNDGGFLKAGYSRVLHLHGDRFRLQPGVDLDGVLGGNMELGRIDNKTQTIQILGYTAAPPVDRNLFRPFRDPHKNLRRGPPVGSLPPQRASPRTESSRFHYVK